MIVANLDMGGLKMLHVKNVVHCLRIKWMKPLTQDAGLTWSHFVWLELIHMIPCDLLQGLQSCPESVLSRMDDFYTNILRSYTFVNDLFYKNNKMLSLPINLWGQPKSPGINMAFCASGFFTVADLLLQSNGKMIDYRAIQNKLNKNKPHTSSFLVCYKLQTLFAGALSSITHRSGLVREELIQQSKSLLCELSSVMLSLTKWELYFHLMPKSKVSVQMVFQRMLLSCKYSKFCEVNFKILARILLRSLLGFY